MCHLFKCFTSVLKLDQSSRYTYQYWSPGATNFLVLVQVPVDQNHLTEGAKLFVLSITIFLNLRDLKFVIQTSKNCLTQFHVSSRTPCPISSVNNE